MTRRRTHGGGRAAVGQRTNRLSTMGEQLACTTAQSSQNAVMCLRGTGAVEREVGGRGSAKVRLAKRSGESAPALSEPELAGVVGGLRVRRR